MLYNAEQVKRMFEEHAILFDDQEGVTIYDAIILFGKDAFEWAFQLSFHETAFPCFGDPDMGPCEAFVSYSGFRLVATYANLLELRRIRKEAKMVNPFRDISPKPKAKTAKHQKSTTPKVIDICTMLKANTVPAAKQKVR